MVREPSILREAYHYLQQKAPVLYVILSEGDTIVAANQYTNDLTGRPLIGEKFQDLIVDFTGKFDLAALIKEQSKEHLLNIETASGLPQSLYFSFNKIKDYVQIFGRLDDSATFFL